jgi:hypothetical protein
VAAGSGIGGGNHGLVTVVQHGAGAPCRPATILETPLLIGSRHPGAQGLTDICS